MKKCGFSALVALMVCGTAVQAAPDMLVNLTAGNFSAVSVPEWVNTGTLGGSFVPTGTGAGVTYAVVDGVPAVTFAGTADSVLTNGVSPNAICGTAPWSWEIWVHNPAANASAEDVFTWTARENWPGNVSAGSCMEFRYGSDTANAVEHYGTASFSGNLTWGGAVPAVGQWHHVAVTRDTNGFERLYLDGNLRETGLRSSLSLRSDVGCFTLAGVRDMRGTTYGTFFSGSIARLRIYDGMLGQNDVIANYKAECAEFSLSEAAPESFLWNGTPGLWEDWNTPSKWAKGVAPTDGKNVFIDNKGKAKDFATTNTFPNLYGTDGGLHLASGLLAVANPPSGITLANAPGHTFDLDLKGGTFEVFGGTNPHLYLGRDGGSANVTVGGGTELAWLCVDGMVQVAKAPTGRGYMEVLQNGLVTVSNNSVYVTAEGGTGTVVVAGGTIRAERGSNFALGHGAGAQAKLIVNDGLAGIFGDFIMSQSNQTAANLSELYMKGGTLWTTRIYGNSPATNIVYMNGGTLRNRDSRTGTNADNGFIFYNVTNYVQVGGAHFEVIPNTSIDINLPLIEDPSSPGGGLKKTGSGTLLLRGANTFTGDIIVEDGQLNLNTVAALPSGVTRILVNAPGAIGYNIAGGADILLGLIDKNSTGTLLLYSSNNANGVLDLSQYPYLSIASVINDAGYSGSFLPANNVYRFMAANGYYNAVIPAGSVIIEAASPRTSWLVFQGNNQYTGGTSINGGCLEIRHANALGLSSGGRDIGIYNGAALKFNNNVNAAAVQAIIARIKTDSYGVLLLTGNNNGGTYDLSQHPGLSLSSDTGPEFDPTATLFSPYASSTYRLGGGYQALGSDGLKIKNMVDDGPTPRNIVIDFPGNPVRLWTNNTFTGGIIVTNGGNLSTRDVTAMGGPLATPRPDYVYIDNGGLRPNPDGMDVPYLCSLPDHSLWVGDGGMTVAVPNDRGWVWQGDLNGTGAITNQENGLIVFGGADNKWAGTLTLTANSDAGTVAIGWGANFSWEKTNVIQGNSMFGVATDLDITWSDKFEKPLGNVPPQYDAPDGTAAPLGLRKLGAGTLTLDVPGTYRRMTKIESGTLKVGAANAIPWGGNKGNLHIVNGNLYPPGTLDINGFDVNVNGFNGSGSITNSAGGSATLIIGNNNQGGTYYGTVAPSVAVKKVGNSAAQNFWKGASLGDLATERGPLYAGAGTSYGNVALKTANTTDNTGFYVGLNATHAYGLMGEYYRFDADGTRYRMSPATLVDIDVLDALLAQYAANHVESSFSFGATFDAGYTGTGAPGSKFQGGFNGGNRFYARWTGEFYAEAPGDYVFAASSDDGSAVYIDRQPAVTNSYSQSLTKRTGEPITLTQGWHDIVVAYYQDTGERGLIVYMTPPGGAEEVLPQRLLRMYPVKVNALSGIFNSKVELYTNSTLIVAGSPDNVYSGRLVAAATDARLIKDGPDAAIFAGQKTPEFNGQMIVASGTLELRNANPFMRPVYLEEGATLAAMPIYDVPSPGLVGFYYDTNYGGGLADGTAVDNYFASLAPRYVASTLQTGPLAVADSPNFWYAPNNSVGAKLFPGPYSWHGSQEHGTLDGNKEQFRVRYQGKFLALEPGNYTFGAISDDRLDVFVDGTRIIERTNAGVTEALSSAIYLEAGSHDFQAVLGQGTSDYYLGIRVAEPGDVLKQLPNALLRPGVSTICGWEGGGALALPAPGSFLRLELADAKTLDVDVAAAPGAGFEKNGLGTLTVIADNGGFYGEWFVMKGEMVVGDGDVSGSLGPASRLHVAAGARVVFNRSDDIVFTGLVTGHGEICNTGSGRVILCNIGDGFKGTFTGGDFVITGTSDVSAASLIQGSDPLNLRFEDGAKVSLWPLQEPPQALAPIVFSNATVTLKPGYTNAYYMDTLMVQAGGTVALAAPRVSGLIGRYYSMLSNIDPGTVTGYYTDLNAAETFLLSHTLLHKASTWAAGDTMDFGEGGAQFPPAVITRKEYFGAIWKGKILITQPGEYEFQTRSDDNSILAINGNRIVNNNGSHAMQYASGAVTLTADQHDIGIAYYQGNGGYGLRVYIKFPGAPDFELLPNSMLFADPDDVAGLTSSELAEMPQASATGQSFTFEVGTLGVVDGPGVGTVDITGGELPVDGTLLLNDLYIEAPGAELAFKGKTHLAGSNLHVTMGAEPNPSTRTLIADFTQAPDYGLLLNNKTRSLDGVMNGKLDYKNGLLYLLKTGGTILILR